MKIVYVFMALIMAVMMALPVFAQVSENFTLNFPSGNGTVTNVTFAAVSQAQAYDVAQLIPIVVIVAIIFGALYIFYVRYIK